MRSNNDCKHGYGYNKNSLRFGDILLVSGNGASSIAVKFGTLSKYSHALIYAGNGIAYESVREGIRRVSIDSLRFDSPDKYIALRYKKGISKKKEEAMHEFMIRKINEKYDIKQACLSSVFLKSLSNAIAESEFEFCSRFVVRCYNCVNLDLWKSSGYTSPIKLINNNMEVVNNFSQEYKSDSQLAHSVFNVVDQLLIKLIDEYSFKTKKVVYKLRDLLEDCKYNNEGRNIVVKSDFFQYLANFKYRNLFETEESCASQDIDDILESKQILVEQYLLTLKMYQKDCAENQDSNDYLEFLRLYYSVALNHIIKNINQLSFILSNMEAKGKIGRLIFASQLGRTMNYYYSVNRIIENISNASKNELAKYNIYRVSDLYKLVDISDFCKNEIFNFMVLDGMFNNPIGYDDELSYFEEVVERESLKWRFIQTYSIDAYELSKHALNGNLPYLILDRVEAIKMEIACDVIENTIRYDEIGFKYDPIEMGNHLSNAFIVSLVESHNKFKNDKINPNDFILTTTKEDDVFSLKDPY